MTNPGGYDPFEHAERLGIQIIYRRLTTANGFWVPDLHAIFLQPRMRAVHERSTLAHELGHACLGHTSSNQKQERQADIFAARHLIDPEHLDYIRKTTPDPRIWANELGVTPILLEAYIRHIAA